MPRAGRAGDRPVQSGRPYRQGRASRRDGGRADGAGRRPAPADRSGTTRWARSAARSGPTALDLLGFERQVVFSSFCARPIFEAAAAGRAMPSRGPTTAPWRRSAGRRAADRRRHRPARRSRPGAGRDRPRRTALGLGAVWVAAAPPGGRSPGHRRTSRSGRRWPSGGCRSSCMSARRRCSIEAPWMNDGRPGPAHRARRRRGDRLEGPDGDPSRRPEVHLGPGARRGAGAASRPCAAG